MSNNLTVLLVVIGISLQSRCRAFATRNFDCKLTKQRISVVNTIISIKKKKKIPKSYEVSSN